MFVAANSGSIFEVRKFMVNKKDLMVHDVAVVSHLSAPLDPCREDYSLHTRCVLLSELLAQNSVTPRLLTQAVAVFNTCEKYRYLIPRAVKQKFEKLSVSGIVPITHQVYPRVLSESCRGAFVRHAETPVN